jgi:hypothetical protein
MSNPTTGTKISVVKKCTFTSTWDNPQGGTLYYHNVEFINGDTGVCGRTKQEPDDMTIGKEVEYLIPANNKIKFIRNTGVPVNSYSYNKPSGNVQNKTGGGRPKAGPDTFLGYSYAYAKDMVIAGKTKPKDLEDLKSIAEQIYTHIKELLKQD